MSRGWLVLPTVVISSVILLMMEHDQHAPVSKRLQDCITWSFYVRFMCKFICASKLPGAVLRVCVAPESVLCRPCRTNTHTPSTCADCLSLIAVRELPLILGRLSMPRLSAPTRWVGCYHHYCVQHQGLRLYDDEFFWCPEDMGLASKPAPSDELIAQAAQRGMICQISMHWKHKHNYLTTSRGATLVYASLA
jgi:hypothetical protein